MMNRDLIPLPQRRQWLLHSLIAGVMVVPMVAAAPAPHRAIAATTAIAQAPTRPILRLGSDGNAVSEIQAILMLLDYFEGPVDGRFQATTEAAVQTFQADVGLKDDGIVGPATWEKLLPTPSTEFTPPAVPPETVATDEAPEEDAADAPIELPTLRQGMTGPAVSRVQETLRSRGFYRGAIDGIFGPATEEAIMAFQRSVELADDGVVGPATWQALLQ